MLIYVVIIFITIFFGVLMKPNKNSKNKKKYIGIIFFMLAVVAGIRSNTVGVDTAQFTSSYEIINHIDFLQYNTLRFEVGFFALCKILNYVTTNYQILLVVTSFIIFGAMGTFIYKNSKDVILSSVLFITLNYFALYMSLMRQAIAIAILVFAFEYLKQKKFLKYTILVLLASLFHQTAITMLALMFLADRPFHKKYIYITLIISVVAFLSANTIFNLVIKIFPIYAGYSESGFFESNYFAALINALVSLVILLVGMFCNYQKDGESNNDLLAYIMCINYITYVITVKIGIFARATTYFSYFSIIWLANAISEVSDVKQKILIKYSVFICTILYWLVIAIYRPEWHGVIPYKTFM